jgi:CPA2 family monovalent cation:H+ antiporter-2
MAAEGFLKDLAMVLITAAVVAVVFQRLRQPTVLGYLLAGLVIGPNVPAPLFADVESVRSLAELGVTLLMFSIGLEFSMRKLLELGRSALFVTAIEVALLFWMGFLVGGLFGWGPRESACLGAIVSIASTMVVAKMLGERPCDPRVRGFVLGVLVVEDVVSMLLLALLTAMLAGADLGPAEFALSSLKLLAFLTALLVVGLALVPRLLRWVMATGSREVILLAAVGVCFLFSLLAKRAGYSIALGAFIAGSVVAEAGHGRILEPLVRPVRDIFAAVFFVAVGMMIDPVLVVQQLPLALTLVAVIVVGKLLGLSLGGVLSGAGIGPSLRGALWLVPVAEYQFLVADLARQSGVRGSELLSVAAAVCVVTVVIAPLLVTRSERIASAIERRLPRRLALFETLYGTWIEALGKGQIGANRRPLARLGLWLAVDTGVILAVVIACSVWRREFASLLDGALGIGRTAADFALLALACLACAPFGFGVLRASNRLARLIAGLALPGEATPHSDMAAAPRRALATTVQVGALIVVGVPVLALSAPFVPSLGALAVVAVVATFAALAFRRRVDDFEGHFRAGSQVVLEALVNQSRAAVEPPKSQAMEQVTALLPGLGSLTAVRIDASSGAIGRTLEDLDLYAHTGASVVCVARGGKGWTAAADQALQSGDYLALTGTPDEIARASAYLARPPSGALRP